MSLDVYLKVVERVTVTRGPRIFVRESGATREISREQWDALYPGREPVTVLAGEDETNCVYSANITHNLNAMAENAGIYMHLWRPDQIGIMTASQLIAPLTAGL